jgi:pentatricopeptide repeat protein
MLWNSSQADAESPGETRFEEIPNKDLISWSSMMSGYSQASQFSDALELFRQMQRAQVKPDLRKFLTKI